MESSSTSSAAATAAAATGSCGCSTSVTISFKSLLNVSFFSISFRLSNLDSYSFVMCLCFSMRVFF